jgi:PAS domain S-box-containing protein
VDRDLRILWANRINETQLGIDRSKIIGDFCYRAFTGRDHPCADCPTVKAMESGQVEHSLICETDVKGIPGPSYWADYAVPLPDANGRISTLLQVSRNITELKQAQLALERSERRYRSILEAMKDATYICSGDFILGYMNPRMISMVGRDVTGERCYQALYERDRQCPWCAVEQVRRGRCVDTELTGPWDGRRYAVTHSPVSDPDGRVAMLTVMRDVTAIVEMERQLRQIRQFESIQTMAGGIAHDFNNLLFAVTGNAELALGDLPAGSPARVNLVRIRETALRAAAVVRQLLILSRAVDHKKEPLALSGILAGVLAVVRSTALPTIQVHLYPCRDDPTVLVDSAQIQRALISIATNALQAMKEGGGTLDIRTTMTTIRGDKPPGHALLTDGDYAVVTVSDSGTGIRPEHFERVFDPYFTTRDVGEGKGMGLSVAQGIVRKHGGDIFLESVAGQGTTVSVLLPLIAAGADDHRGGKPSTSAFGGNETLLFVDDEEAVRDVVPEMLRRLGYQVHACADPLDALARFRSDPRRFDLVITDMSMPHMSGDRLIEEIRLIRGDIPVLLCSGHSHVAEDVFMKKMERVIPVFKPIELDSMARKIRQALGMGKPRRPA